jgi:hypothetical protein
MPTLSKQGEGTITATAVHGQSLSAPWSAVDYFTPTGDPDPLAIIDGGSFIAVSPRSGDELTEWIVSLLSLGVQNRNAR